MKYLLLCVFLQLAVAVFAVDYNDCGSTATVIEVDVSDCTAGEKCQVKAGGSKDFTIEFTANSDSENVTAILQGSISTITMNVKLPDKNACNTGVTCPMKSGDTNTYTTTVDIASWYPKGDTTITFQLIGDDKEKIVCVKIAAEIV